MLRIITNNHRREVLYWPELTQAEQREHDWILESDTQDIDTVEFFRYKGWTYCLSDIMRVESYAPVEFQGWDGYVSETFFSGILVKYAREDDWGIDYDHVIVASYYSGWEG